MRELIRSYRQARALIDERRQDPLLTQRQVCEMLQIAPATLKQWRRAGRIRFVQLGYRTVRIRESEVNRLCEARTS